MIVNQVFQNFPTWFIYVIRSANYDYARWIDQLLGYHINNRFSGNKLSNPEGCSAFRNRGESTKRDGNEKNDLDLKSPLYYIARIESLLIMNLWI